MFRTKLRRSPQEGSGGGNATLGGDTDPAVSNEPAGGEPAEGEAGNEPQSWMSVLPAEARNDPEVSKYKTPEDFYSAYKSKVEMIGKKGIIQPKEGADQAEWDKFYNELGRPEDPDGYKLDTPEGLHESIKVTPESQKEFQNLAHKWGLNNSQASEINKTLLEAMNQVVVNHEKSQTEAMQNTEAELRKEWGEKFDANQKLVGSVAKKILGEEGIDALGGAEGLGNNPYFNKLIYSLASQMSEDTINKIPSTSNTGAPAGELTPDQAKKEMGEMQDPGTDFYKQLFDENHPKHDAAVQRRQKVYQALYGSEAS